MKNLLQKSIICVAIVTITLGFTSCTNDTEENAELINYELQLVTPGDDGTVETAEETRRD